MHERSGQDGVGQAGQFDWSETEPSTAVVESVAAVSGQPVEALPPLYESVDPDGLDALFVQKNGADGTTEVQFAYANHQVTVSSDGRVTARQQA